MTMMECPRCGFQQPTDQFCAKCGVNVQTYVKKPKPLFVRLLQNPNFHLSLIAILIVFVVGWIFYSRANDVKLEVGRLVGTPISSRDAADPAEVAAQSKMREEAQQAAESAPPEVKQAPTEALTAAREDAASEPITIADSTSPEKAAATVAAPTPSKVEVSYWEIPREILLPVLQQAQPVGQGNGARAYFLPQNAKLNEILNSGAQSLAAAKTMSASQGTQMTVETPPTSPEMFQFGLMVQMTKAEAKNLAVRFDSRLVLPQPEPAGAAQPAVRRAAVSALSGASPLTSSNAIAIVFEPMNRRPSEEILARAGDGPWSVFSSPEYRSGLTDWVIVIELK
jgi:hypothetical protein